MYVNIYMRRHNVTIKNSIYLMIYAMVTLYYLHSNNITDIQNDGYACILF